ncbi:hypothetical protein ACFY0P_43590 [Streptomyces sp. NPDC001714]|uniref:hypothetical protein n=1 Tax=Streptomyces sp. NPDC001714 TaxID=3364603 RepID=UPI0036D1D4C8
MDGAAFIIIILAIAGVASALLYALKGILDQLPDVFDSARRAGDAWKRLRGKPEVVTKPDGPPLPVADPEDDEESPAAA